MNKKRTRRIGNNRNNYENSNANDTMENVGDIRGVVLKSVPQEIKKRVSHGH